MAFKYINPGYAELLSVKDGVTVTGDQYSKTGVSFWQPTYYKGLNLSEVPPELYGRFDMYIKDTEKGGNAKLSFAIGGYKIIEAEKFWSTWKIRGSNNNEMLAVGDAVRVKEICTVWFHIKPGENGNGVFHAIIDEREVCNMSNAYVGYLTNSDAKTIAILTKNDDILISNLILSDEEISPREQVITLPVKETQTNMTDYGDGSYEATAANQELLQTVDVAALSAQYGADSRVTGISLIGNPAYRTAEGLCALTAIEKSGGNVTEYGRHIAEQNPTSTVMDTRTVSMTIAELTGRQFGWRAGV